MGSWIALLVAILRAAGSLAAFARERQWLKAGEAQALAELMRKQADDLLRAEQARDAARRNADGVPRDRGLPDDGFRRD